MKRSEINDIIAAAEIFFDAMNFKLPPWAFWGPKKWKGTFALTHEIVDNMLGWDITDFGLREYRRQGLLLFTIRNGNLKLDAKPYAEKAMIVDIGQDTPMHFHWHKMEDIINRGGGVLVIELFMADRNEELSDAPVHIKVDGIERAVPAGGKVVLNPGESICLPPYVYHKFYAEKAMSLIGEVSMVNDDTADNRFLKPIGRFPVIEEDAPPRHLLVSDYRNYSEP
ncbi:MAG: D-lyxose/D-mannose family sugar isomerase [Spirochaetes bacterium]|nr:D-lyxose/D-mannose family sugar isomerase [Spirochaetota bacterium]